MLSISRDEIRRWRIEIDNAEVFRKDNFGLNDGINRLGAGENIEYFERGVPFAGLGIRDSQTVQSTVNLNSEENHFHATLNMIYTLAKNIVPALYFRNPKILAFPKRKQDEESAPVAAALLNYYFNELGIKETDQQIILDAYLLGMGICKIGYATQFGMDIKDKSEKKRREKSRTDKILEGIGLKKPQEEIKQNVELQENVVAENPYVVWVNPFDFLIDPRATSIHNAQWVCHMLRKNLDEVKKNPNFKNTKDLKGIEPPEDVNKDIPPTELDKFKTINLYEIHYKTPEGINLLVVAKDGEQTEFLYHDKSIYKMDGFQFEILQFNKHGHKLYAKSDVSIIKPLQDRLTITFDSILDQVDKFVQKLFVDETGLTKDGENALVDGNLGSIVKCNKNPNEVFRETNFTQLKSDMLGLVNQLVDIITLETGLTRAQLTGLTTAQTATEAQIGQGGSNIRLFARADAVGDFSNRQSRKLWQVIRQFTDFEQIQLITGEEAVDEEGIPRYSWLPDIDSSHLAKAELRFDIQVSSTQKPDVAVVRKEWENFINIMAKTDVVALIQQQGSQINISELIKQYLGLFPEMIKDIGKIIKPIQTGQPGAMTPEMLQAQLAKLAPGGGGGQSGIRENMLRQPPQTPTSAQEQLGGEAGQL